LGELLEAAWIEPVILRNPQINVLAVEKLNVPRGTVRALSPVEFSAAQVGIKRVRIAGNVIRASKA